MHRHSRRVLTSAALTVLVGCGGDSPTKTTEPPIDTTHVAVPRVGSIAISGPTEISGPGVVRATVDIQNPTGGGIYDTITTDVAITGPFTTSWDRNEKFGYRVLNIVASGPGTGSITVTADGKSASIAITAEPVSFQSISVADGYACGIAVDQRAWCWGANDVGELGMATAWDCNGGACQYGGNRGNATPLPVDGNQKFTAIATHGISSCSLGTNRGVCGRTCALTAAGDASCWGLGYSPGAGMKFAALSVVTSTFVPSEGGAGKTCGLTVDGAVYCFAPAAMAIGNGMIFESLSVGRYHSCGVATAGDVYCWGSNEQGNFGTGSADTLVHVDPVRAIASTKFTSVAVGDYSTCALDTTGTVYCWGRGYSATGANPPPVCPLLRGFTGTSPFLCQTTPRPIQSGGTYASFSRASSSVLTANGLVSHLCGLTTAGAVSCWTSFNGEPSAVSVPEPLANISAGAFLGMTGCGVSTSHVGYCWGGNYVGSKVGQ